MKKQIFLLFVSLSVGILSVDASTDGNSIKKQEGDTSSYISLTAKIIDGKTKAPVVFATVYQTGTSIGTVSNADGEFLLKIPKEAIEGSVSITHLGYKNLTVAARELRSGKTTISLESYAIPIEELIVKNITPEGLIIEALSRKRENYPTEPEMQTAFYRETIKQNRNYVSISEAVLDIYNAGYKENFDFDRVKIYKGRKSKDVKRMDTVLVKFQGGPRTAMFLDLMKNPGVILDPEMFSYYDFSFGGMVKINERSNYVIHFDQNKNIEEPLYSGSIYIDEASKAITSVDFKLSENSLKYAVAMLVKSKPASMDMEVLSGNYLVKYREIEGKWILNYVRAEVVFRSKWDRQLFRSNIHTMFEMAITDRDLKNIDRFPYKVAVKFNDVLAEQVEAFEDTDYWGEYNTIKPDLSIEEAIEKLNKRLQRD